jgi:membrane protein DedA with SNARE-associated domain
VGRLVPAVRQLISIPAGLARMKVTTFLLYTTLGAGVWNSVLAAIGYYLSTVPGIETEEQLLEQVNKYSHELGMVILALVIVAIAMVAYKSMKKKRDK